MKKLLQLLAFIVMLPVLAEAQGTCPTMYSRNNGNGGASGCPGAGTTAQSSNVTGTVYSYSTCCSSLSKEGDFFLKWPNSVAPTYVPAVKTVYVNGAIQTVKFGPPSAFDGSSVSGNQVIKYCFYNTNVANAAKLTVEFVNPLNDTPFATCNYTWSGSGDIAPLPGPTFTSEPASLTRCTGGSATFSVSATPGTAGHALSYQWRKDGNVITGATNASYSISSVAFSDSGYYTCRVTEATALTISTSANAKLTVSAGATPNISNFTSPSATTACASSASTITVNSTTLGAGSFTVTYDISGANSSTGNTATLVMSGSIGTFSVPGSLLASMGTNTVTITSIGNGSCVSSVSASNAATFTTTGVPTSVSAAVSATQICNGTNLTLTGSATNATSWAWSGPGGYSSTSQSPTFAISTANAGVFTLVATNSCGSATAATTSSVTVYTGTPTSASASASATQLCAGSNLTLTGGATNATVWAWNGPGGYTSIAQSPAFAVTAGNTGVFTLVASNACGNSSQATTSAVSVFSAAPTSVSAGASATQICSGSNITLTGGATNATSWAWTGPGSYSSSSQSPTFAVGATNAGVYTLVASNACGSTSQATTASVSVFTAIPSSVTASASATQKCAGSNLTLTGAATNATSWTWSGPGGYSSSSQSPTFAIAAGNAGVFTMVASNACGSTAQATTASVSVNSSIPSSVSANVSASSLCSGAGLTLTSVATGAASYSWSGPGSFSSTDQNPAAFVVTTSNAGIYTVTATNACGSSTATTAAVTVNTVPSSVSANASSSSLCSGAGLTLTSSATGATSFAWSGPGSYNSTAQNPAPFAVTTSNAGTYTVTATNSCGTSIATTTAVTVNPLPNAGSISGAASINVGATITLSSTVSGGIWTSSDIAVASVGTSSGVVSGLLNGTTTISYSYTNACGTDVATAVVTVNTLSPIAGPSSVLVGNSITLTDATTGGIWSSSNNTVAAIGTNGVVTAGTSAGVITITYTVGGAYVTYDVTINAIQPIAGPTSVLVGNSITLSNATTGGVWSSSNNTVAAIGTNGVVTAGTSAGVVTITYAVGGAYVTYDVTVNAIQPIAGPSSVLVGNSITLSDATTGGVWSSSNSTVAAIGTNGVVTAGTTSGTVTITYTVGGAYVTYDITVNAIQAIAGPTSVLVGNSITLSDATSGGVWSSSNSTVAAIGTNGVVTAGSASGTVTITYTVGGAYVTYDVTVNAIQPITGATDVVAGASISLDDATPGGTWSTSDPAVATIGADGVLIGIAPGTVTITYTIGVGFVTRTLTVNSISAIAGVNNVCAGSTITLTDATPSGSWNTSDATVATVNSGVITGVAQGTALISYTVTGVTVTKTVTVNDVAAITGTYSVCVSSTVTLSNATSGGTWSSSTPAVAIIGSTSGVVSGVASGVTNITYTTVAGCKAVAGIAVNPLPSVAGITGATTVCEGSTITLNDATPAGVWLTSNSSVADVNTDGVVMGVSSGNAIITYSVVNGVGCTAMVTQTVTVSPLPAVAAIAGTATACAGMTTTLTNTTTAGVWSSGTTSVATIGSSSGIVAGLSNGTSSITYTKTGGGCSAAVYTVVTVTTAPAISGSALLCAGQLATLTNTATDGTWSSSNTATVTIGSATGIVTPVAFGTAIITYTQSAGCYSTKVVSVNVSASAITGSANICVGSTATYSNPTGGGFWSASNPSVADVDPTGVVTSYAIGNSTITYSMSSGCYATVTATVNAYPAAISGVALICTGNNITLADANPGGTWSSNDATIATVGSTNGVVSSVNVGTAVITYTSDKGCSVTTSVANPMNVISGSQTMCKNLSQTLVSLTSGGTWSVSDTSIATVNATGVVTARSTVGSATVTYALPSGCYRTLRVDVVSSPSAITGAATVCPGEVITLSTAATGGYWRGEVGTDKINGPSGDGHIVGLAPGVATVTYALSPTCYVLHTITVNPLPVALTGVSQICQDATTTFASLTTGGTWLTSNSSVASVSPSTGTITGVSGGTAMITYMLSATGCYRTKTITINPTPPGIDGTKYTCAGSTTMLSNTATTPLSWASSTPSVATIAPTGLVTGVSGGTTTITFTIGNLCYTTSVVTVQALPATISGQSTVCPGAIANFSSTDVGGTWSSSNTSLATVDPIFGNVTGGTGPGVVTITYTYGGIGCKRTKNVTVNPVPAAISGSTSVCVGAVSTLSNGGTGGTWISSDASIATVGSTNRVVTGVTPGTVTITNTAVTTGCTATTVVTVVPTPAAISGAATISAGSINNYSNSVPGGTWTSSNTTVATVDGSTGDVSALVAGNVTITYTIGTGCYAVKAVTVSAINPIVGTMTVCIGSATSLSCGTPGGTWSSSDISIAAFGSSSGVVSGLAAGTATITYTKLGVYRTAVVTVNTSPTAISGSTVVCAGSTFALTHAISGGTWTSSNASVSIVGSASGIVTGVGAGGNATITYTVAAGCYATTDVTINPNPASISGSAAICEGQTRTFSTAATVGTWTISDPSVATIDAATGVATAVTPGAVTVTYILPTGCYNTAGLTVNVLPAAITGAAQVCMGQSITLGNTSTGTWTNWFPLNASGPSVDGVVTGITAGTTLITFTAANGCARYTVVTINPLPNAISGTNQVCPGLTTTLANGSVGGAWNTDLSFAGIASVNAATGIVTGIGTGTAIVTYTLPTGCYSTRVVTVNTTAAAITGVASVCPGGTTSLSCSSSGGTSWASSNTAVATVGGTGLVAGVAPGTATITYVLGTGCNSTIVVTVNSVPAAIAGVLKACPGSSTALSNTVAGGVWTAANPAVATIDPSTGVATGVAAGNTTITYSAGAGCYKTAAFAVNANPPAISGNTTVCMGTSVTLTDASGTWSSSTPAVATVPSTSGYVAGVAPGTSTITFTQSSTGCIATQVVTVIPAPSASTGGAGACAGQSVTLSNSTSGGTWTSSNTAIATAGSTTGTVTAVGAGTATISYIINSTCRVLTSFPVKALPATISGTLSVCMPAVTTLSEGTSGGTWSSSNTSVATVGSGTSAIQGLVTGLSAGTTEITYTITSTGCYRSAVVTVNAGPNAGTINSSTGSFTLRLTSSPTATLTSTGDAGGTWTSGNPAVVTVNPTTGVLTAVAAGNTLVTYSVTSACTNMTTKLIIVATGKEGNNTVTSSDVAAIRLYPNPTNGSFSLVSEEAGVLHVFSIDGKEITNYTVSAGTNPLSLPRELASGVYMCRFTGENGSTTIVRLVYEP